MRVRGAGVGAGVGSSMVALQMAGLLVCEARVLSMRGVVLMFVLGRGRGPRGILL